MNPSLILPCDTGQDTLSSVPDFPYELRQGFDRLDDWK